MLQNKYSIRCSRSSWVIEMMTIDYKNKNYEKSYKDFIKYENSYIEYANTIINNYIKNMVKLIIIQLVVGRKV